MGQNTVRHNLGTLKNKFISILLWFLVLSWTGFLLFSRVIDQMYWYDNSSRIDTFIAREKIEVPSLSGGSQGEYLILEDKSGRLITLNNVSPSYWNLISRNEIIRAKIEECNISNTKHTPFQICVMWYSFILPLLIFSIWAACDKSRLIYGTWYFPEVAVIYLIIGFIVTASLW